jgi:rod shape-determining protein MreC
LSFNSGQKINQFKILSFGTFAAVNDFFLSLGDGFVSRSKYEDQLKKNAQLMLKNSLMRTRIENTNRIESLLSLKQQFEHELLSCRIITKNGSLFDGRIIIDVGHEDGASIGLPIIDDSGLIGIISEVHSNYSVAKHLYNNELNIAVTFSRSNTEGILSWNGTNLIVQDVPTTKDIKINDELMTSSFSSIFPPVIPIGKVLRVDASVAGILSDVVVQPYTDIESAYNTFVLLVNEDSLFRDSTSTEVIN